MKTHKTATRLFREREKKKNKPVSIHNFKHCLDRLEMKDYEKKSYIFSK